MAATPGIPCLPDYLTALATLNLHGLALAPDIERVLFDIVPMETRKEGGRLLHDAIRRVWVSGMMFADYRRESQGAAPEPSPPAPPVDLSVSEAAVEAARAAYTSALEAERVWGFDVGYRVAVGTLSTHSPPSAPSPSPSTPAPPVADNVPADVAVAVAPVDDSPSPPLFPPRDLSALRPDTGTNVFSSLQRRRRRIAASRPSPHDARPPQDPKAPLLAQPKMRALRTRSIPTCYQAPRVPCSHSDTNGFRRMPASSSSRLDWDRDPRLRDLGRALTALGWSPPG